MTTINRIWIPTLAAAVLSATFVVSAVAQPINRLAEELNLTAEQQESLAAIREEFHASRTQDRDNRDALKAASESGDVDAAADLAASQARNKVYQKAEMRQRLSEILSVEQLKQWDTLRESRTRGRKGQRSRGGQRGQRNNPSL